MNKGKIMCDKKIKKKLWNNDKF